MSHTTTAYIVAAVAVLLTLTMAFGRKNKFDVAGKFVYIPGGSAGLGASLAEALLKRGAHVAIVARDAKRAEATVSHLKTFASDSQKVFYVQADLTSRTESDAALEAASKTFGASPDYVFLCAGFSKPQYFVEASPEDLQSGLDGVYWVSAWTAHAVVKRWVKEGKKGTLTFVSSFLGYTSFAGYSPYSPGKYALRGLADSLRSELQLHDITVHLYMPAGILSPGYENEQKTKPGITKQIEEGDTPIAPEAAAALLIKGLERGNYQITNDLVTDLVRVASKGPVPGNGLLDLVYGFIGFIGLPIWRADVDSKIRKAAPAVTAELKAKGVL
ncbi:3-ketodihydrosphingosine reductase TSC10 [Vanrija pseudolonga]|uniref:3-dehydrosphinganine reductase n=1 Tax=Vanrija pseudolonga TaxID=143232 RepID=A0AAF1BMC6_9TREE|nr:3-ketodihydrosphingosine reductase TSC10 [Vanrija pseudolonga]